VAQRPGAVRFIHGYGGPPLGIDPVEHVAEDFDQLHPGATGVRLPEYCGNRTPERLGGRDRPNCRGRPGDAKQARELLGQTLTTARERGLANLERRTVQLLT
jgi:hypothetical protein